MRELPSANVFQDFYIWFNLKEKEEYFSTPLYLYSVLRKENKKDITRQYLELEKDISKVKTNKKREIIRHPSTIYIHYAENIGAFLINFLNADFTNYETAYNTFFYAYGFELLKDYVPYQYTKNEDFIDDSTFRKIIEDIFNSCSDKLIEWQNNFKKCVDFIYNLNGNESLKEENRLSKFIAYTIKDNEFYTYSKGIEIITDDYINAHHKHHNSSLNELIKEINNRNQELELHNVYVSNNLVTICFIVLDHIVRQENLQIKTCQNCGRYFIPTQRQSKIYCDLPNVDKTPTCSEKGAREQYTKNLKDNKLQMQYRKIYQTKVMVAYRHKEDTQIQEDFENWKKEARDKIDKVRTKELKESEVLKWLKNSK